VLQRWREAGRGMPVIVLSSSRREVADMRAGVKAGATNYLLKPVDMDLLLDWVRGVVNSAGPNATLPELRQGALRIDSVAHRVTLDGRRVHLAPTEYKFLHYLLVHRARTISRRELIDHLFDRNSANTEAELSVYVQRLREKTAPGVIETVRGFGYRLGPCDGSG